ncbi:hypothetical protein ACFWM1_30430 [Nocardia sp. NPDC058379]|uniref:hypothetical protein n=1 Tax=unclassified Nocardia TaxID=2637762 RepID=UPI00364B83F3
MDTTSTWDDQLKAVGSGQAVIAAVAESAPAVRAFVQSMVAPYPAEEMGAQ